MTDNEIIKALDICGHLEACADCPLGCLEGVDKCMHTLLLNALDLINRQKAEIEKWKAECENQSVLWRDHFESIFESAKETVRAEAIKEFAERLKNELELEDAETWFEIYECGLIREIDNLVKEMTEEKK